MHKRDFFDIDQCRMYLEGCIVRFKDTPRYINRVERDRADPDGLGIVLRHSALGQGEERATTDSLTNPHWDLTPCQLGFVNRSGQVYNVSRTPRRMWKVGFNHRNCNISGFSFLNRDARMPFSTNQIIYSPGMTATVMNKFQSPRVLLKKLKDKSYTIAFSRRFAMDSENNLIYHKSQREPVGKWRAVGTNVIFKLEEDWDHLSEILKEDGGTLE